MLGSLAHYSHAKGHQHRHWFKKSRVLWNTEIYWPIFFFKITNSELVLQCNGCSNTQRQVSCLQWTYLPKMSWEYVWTAWSNSQGPFLSSSYMFHVCADGTLPSILSIWDALGFNCNVTPCMLIWDNLSKLIKSIQFVKIPRLKCCATQAVEWTDCGSAHLLNQVAKRSLCTILSKCHQMCCLIHSSSVTLKC